MELSNKGFVVVIGILIIGIGIDVSNKSRIESPMAYTWFALSLLLLLTIKFPVIKKFMYKNIEEGDLIAWLGFFAGVVMGIILLFFD